MRAFILACLVAVALAAAAAYVLNDYVPDTAAAAFTGSGARI